MRKPFIAGNWKMNLRRDASVGLAREVAAGAAAHPGVDVAVCPPHVYLEAVAQVLAGSLVGLGAQNLYPHGDGAFTGEVNVGMLQDVGCRYVIVGHSERRQFFHETDADVFRKAQAVLTAGLTPIICVGETLAQREASRTREVIEGQFEGSLGGLTTAEAHRIVIAYEPVWAIGTGKVASPEQAEEVHAQLRSLLAARFGAAVAEGVRIQYGGSVKPDNARTLLGQPNIDGALVGGASLKAGDFLAIVAAAG